MLANGCLMLFVVLSVLLDQFGLKDLNVILVGCYLFMLGSSEVWGYMVVVDVLRVKLIVI
ncbi:hypothetical protein [Candidatus Hodgkinia cicadicola]|uniref:hypothetical protein n=1 Tax=Candidatus Hodgkinia cicadicola TaxID=573658 RepID=UPI002414D889